ncbi:hypothetical protein [Fusobacterium sp. MFO224]|uniref:hypothetical protein n=1 Tax=Fusobacterium sp. MFO224 TaxID=3378070 RepID=UPI003854895B
MRSSLLPEPLNFSKCKSIEEQEKLAYDFFCKEIKDQNKREKYNGKVIFLELTPPYFDGKEEVFQHLTGIDESRKYKVDPCVDSTDRVNYECLTRGTADNIPPNQRILCLYRARTLPWFNSVIRMANLKNEYIKIFTKKQKNSRNNSLLIRFQHETVDYLIVLRKNKRDNYKLVTAYPITLNSKKRQLDREYIRNKKAESDLVDSVSPYTHGI